MKRILADEEERSSRVDRSACEFCFSDGEINPQRISEVLGSAILSAGRTTNSRSPADDQLQKWAAVAIAEKSGAGNSAPTSEPKSGPVAAVDVVFPVKTIDKLVATSINAWLHQEGVFVVLHLVCVGDLDPRLLEDYRLLPSIRIHAAKEFEMEGRCVCLEDDSVTFALLAAQQITDSFETPFLAFGSATVEPANGFLAIATSLMVANGLEWYAASLQEGSVCHRPSQPNLRDWKRTVFAESAVIRRSLWVDLGGVAPRYGDADVDFFDRAAHQRRPGRVTDDVQARTIGARHVKPIGVPPPRVQAALETDPFELFREGLGFPFERLACDVVLPFCGQLPYVQEAIDSVLSQANVDLTLHLIDDASPTNIDDWLRDQLEDRRVRVYRNSKNIGQFISFNNVLEFCDSEWIVTQDGDDISLPGRIAESLGIAKRCDADLVGAATILDGPSREVFRLHHTTSKPGDRRRYHRISYPARPDFNTYFLENPTLVHRRAFFERLGGFADFADLRRNRTTLDTDYMVRALHAGANIVSCRRLAVRYRVHGQSAIHHKETRMGSPIRNWSQREFYRRLSLYRRGGINLRTFGALGRHRGVTQPWEG